MKIRWITFFLLATSGCCGNLPRRPESFEFHAINDADIPQIVLYHTPGFVAAGADLEPRLIAAVWKDGCVVKMKSLQSEETRYVQGELGASDYKRLAALVNGWHFSHTGFLRVDSSTLDLVVRQPRGELDYYLSDGDEGGTLVGEVEDVLKGSISNERGVAFSGHLPSTWLKKW